MPALRRRQLRTRAQLSRFWREYFLTGDEWYFLEGAPSAYGIDDEQGREMWEQHGADLTDEFVEKSPFRRFWAFWKFETECNGRCGIHSEEGKAKRRPTDERQWLLDHPQHLTDSERELLERKTEVAR